MLNLYFGQKNGRYLVNATAFMYSYVKIS
jgi:hypothetical protein